MRKLLLAAILAALAGAAVAEPPPSEAGRARRQLFISPSGEPFRTGDGLAAWFAQADADRDGAITLAEFEADAWRAFRLYDTDGDGVIGGLEIQAYERDRAPEISEFSFGDGEAPGRRGGSGGGDSAEPRREGSREAGFRGAGSTGAARFSLLNEPEPLLAADTDIDGKVSRDEWSRATARRFARLDHDHTGRLTLATLRGGSSKH
jgi:hypothetical protein